MYKIGGWKLPSLQKCPLHTIYPHTLILKQRRTFFRTTIHITHPMHLAIGYYCFYCNFFYVNGYRCGDVSITNKSKFAQIHTLIMKKVKIQEQNIMCEKENGKLCRNSWLIKRHGKKHAQSIKNTQQTLDQLHNMVMKQINTTHLHNVKGFFQKLKAWIENSTILLW